MELAIIVFKRSEYIANLLGNSCIAKGAIIIFLCGRPCETIKEVLRSKTFSIKGTLVQHCNHAKWLLKNGTIIVLPIAIR